ncbi:hypothetical protein PCK2_000668 [Pneumocystis canis]|nr:hypothetical protein PCK2_000668 [Pneumocystis canis]
MKRGYTLQKIQENNEAEIMQVVLDEAMTSFGSDHVMILTSDLWEHVDHNVAHISTWIQEWQSSHLLNNNIDHHSY